MMKKTVWQGFIWGMLLFLAACGKENTSDGDYESAGNGQVCVRIGLESSIQTRGPFYSSDNDQDVTYVQLYIFEGSTPESKCIASENVNWRQVAGGSASQTYYVGQKLDKGKTYTLLAVGLDSIGKSTYGLPAAIQMGITTLGDARAQIAPGKSYTDISRASIFAGSREVTIPSAESEDVVTEILLSRRMAGILLYVKNIPYQILSGNFDGGNNQVTATQVKYLQVQLCQPQNTSVSLQQTTPDYGADPATEASRIVVEIDMGGYSKSADGNYFAIDATIDLDKNLSTLPNSLLQGIYVLPFQAVMSQPTLVICLLDESKNILKTYTLTDTNHANASTYDLLANHIYSIGMKSKTDNSDNGDDPLNLQLETRIKVVLIPDYETIYELSDGGLAEK